ncbi:hypothetical protein FXO37_16406 [Capsicum annuum]|nr:hypothetical protein FXO37_16406 [Capsicum annuum]
MGDHDCSKGFYGYKGNKDYGVYEYSNDQEMGRIEGYGFERESEMSEVPSSYVEYGDDEGNCDGSYDEVEECEESYPFHSKPRIGVRYNTFICNAYESYGESAHVKYKDSYSSPCSTFYQGQSGINCYTSYSGGFP